MRRALVCVCLIGSLLAPSFSCDLRVTMVLIDVDVQDAANLPGSDLRASENTCRCAHSPLLLVWPALLHTADCTALCTDGLVL